MSQERKKEIPTAMTKHFPVGAQSDGSSCGYISAWWQIHCQILVNQGSVPVDWESPPDQPDGWNRVCRRLFTIFDMQAEVPSAKAEDIWLRPLFAEAMQSGVFTKGKFFTRIDEYALKLQVCLHSVDLHLC